MKTVWWLVLPGLLVGSAVTAAVPSQMNVQGRLLSGGSPLNGSHPTTFKIFDALTGGSQLWAEDDTVSVQGGIYSTVIGAKNPLGSGVFNGQARWLEVVVDGTTLSPRLSFDNNAYSFRAARADTADVALSGTGSSELWSTDGTNVWRPNNHVGIGTSSPDYTLDIRSPDYLHGLNWQVTTGTETGSYVRFGSNNSRGALWIGNDTPVGGGPPDGAGLLQTTGGWQWNNQLNIMGNVGIGTNSPTNKLQVAGGITADKVAGDWFNTLGATLGNGSVYSLLDDDHLEFHGTYGYGVGDEYIDFQSGYNPGIGGQGSMARITGNRDPAGYDLGQGRLKVSVRSGTGLADILVVDPAGISVNGGLSVSGTKCRVVTTDFGQVKMNAVESAHALFMDDEPSANLVNGRCRVNLSPRFMATVTVNGRYPLAVNITVYGPHGEWYVERDATGFTVVDPSGGSNEFSWQAIARQKSYEDTYLEPVRQTAAK